MLVRYARIDAFAERMVAELEVKGELIFCLDKYIHRHRRADLCKQLSDFIGRHWWLGCAECPSLFRGYY